MFPTKSYITLNITLYYIIPRQDLGAVHHKEINPKSLKFKYIEILTTLYRKVGKIPTYFDRLEDIAVIAISELRTSQENKFIGKWIIRHMDNVNLKQSVGFT